MTAAQQPVIGLRLCDDAGMLSDQPVEAGHPGLAFDPALTYRKVLNNLRSHNRDPEHRGPYTGPPIHCTGSGHFGGEVFRCTSPAHTRTPAPGPFYPATLVRG